MRKHKLDYHHQLRGLSTALVLDVQALVSLQAEYRYRVFCAVASEKAVCDFPVEPAVFASAHDGHGVFVMSGESCQVLQTNFHDFTNILAIHTK